MGKGLVSPLIVGFGIVVGFRRGVIGWCGGSRLTRPGCQMGMVNAEGGNGRDVIL